MKINNTIIIYFFQFLGMFESGQVYVALSRARTLEGLKLVGFDPKFIKIDASVQRFYETMDSILD